MKEIFAIQDTNGFFQLMEGTRVFAVIGELFLEELREDKVYSIVVIRNEGGVL